MSANNFTPTPPRWTGDSDEVCDLGISRITAKTLADITLQFLTYVNYPPLILGVPGNILIILIANRKHNKHLSPSIYMSSMAVVDTTLLVVATVFLTLFYGSDLITSSRELIYIIELTLVVTCGMLSGFYLTAMSVDRLIAVRFPMVAPSLCTASRARKVVLIGTVLIGGSNMNLLYTLTYNRDKKTGIENIIMHVPGDPTGSLLATSFQLIFGTILPFAIIITCNILIIMAVRNAEKQRIKLQGDRKEAKQTTGSETQYLTRMLIFVSMAYVVTSIPYRLYVLALLIPQVAAQIDFNDTCTFILYTLYVTITYGLWVWNFSINFYMYCIGGGKRYRKDSQEVIGALIKCFTKPKS